MKKIKYKNASENQRIKLLYEDKYINNKKYAKKWDPNNFGNNWVNSEKMQLIKKYVGKSLEKNNIVVLDIGCGDGRIVKTLNMEYNNRLIIGLDYSMYRIKKAKKEIDCKSIIYGDAENLPFKNSKINIVMQMTLFTSILSTRKKTLISKEINRVLEKEGRVFWYDFRYSNPFNRNAKGIKKKEICKLFNNYNIFIKSVTLLPWISRKIYKKYPKICDILNKIKLLHTHYFGYFEKIG